MLLLFLTYTFTFLISKVHFYFSCIVKKLQIYHMFHFSATLVAKFLKAVNRVTLASLYIHNLLLCCGDIETNPGMKCLSLSFYHWGLSCYATLKVKNLSQCSTKLIHFCKKLPLHWIAGRASILCKYIIYILFHILGLAFAVLFLCYFQNILKRFLQHCNSICTSSKRVSHIA